MILKTNWHIPYVYLQVIGFSYDKLMLRSVLPTIHTALFNILSTLMRTCHSHLLPYTTTIEACIVQSMSVDNER